MAWRREQAEMEGLYRRLSEKLRMEYSGVQEAGLWTEKGEEQVLAQALKTGALLWINGRSYCFYRARDYNLFYIRDKTIIPMLDMSQKVAFHEGSCRGKGLGDGFFLLASQRVLEKGSSIPSKFWQFRHVSEGTQFQLLEYMADQGEDPLPAAAFYWD